MRKSLLFIISVFCLMSLCASNPQSEISFQSQVCKLGKFSEADPVRTCTFQFKNVGNAPLIINQAIASCGCTVPRFTAAPVQPGDSGRIEVTYDGSGRYVGPFKKIITVHSNAKTKIVRLYIEGEMTAQKKNK